MPKRYMRGDRAFKRLLAQLPETVKNEMIVELNLVGKDQLAREQSRVAVSTGQLKSALSYKVLPNTLKLKVGLIGKAANRNFFYGRIVEFGRNASGRGIKRGTAKYDAGVGAKAARHFVYTQNRESLYRPFRDIWEKALRKAAGGSDE